jgi:hypothetical protein
VISARVYSQFSCVGSKVHWLFVRVKNLVSGSILSSLGVRGCAASLRCWRWFSLHLLFSAVCCNKDLAVSLKEIDGWSPLAPKNYYDQKSILLESQDIISLQDGVCVTSMNKK